jgi:DNA-binding LytR/AlgR family response regulator
MKNAEIQVNGRKQVNPQEIMLLKADVNYTVIYFIDGKKSIVATSLKNLQPRFEPYNFFRTHKSFMVNIDFVKCFLEPHKQVQMIDNQKIVVSRRKANSLKKHLLIG